MKKVLSSFLSIALALFICFGCTSCYLFELTDNGGNLPPANGGNLQNSGDNLSNSTTGTFPNVNDYNSQVYFDRLDVQERELLTRAAAVQNIERSVVEIKMTTTNGASSGSGVIVGNNDDSDNVFYILTCQHVISSQGKISVYVPDKNSRNRGDTGYDTRFAFTGTIDNTMRNNEVLSLIGGDQANDIAVIKFDVTNTEITKDDVVYAPIAPDNSEVYQMKAGEDVFAIGNPGGDLPMTVSAGIISYLDRTVVINSVGYMTLMQIDVPINHGNSGGGLFNLYGELIGITNAGSDVLEGIKYAIPYKHTSVTDEGFVSDAKALIATYNAWGKNNHGYIKGNWSFGITIAAGETTAKIYEVVANSNAYKAGFKSGDVIVRLGHNKNSGYSKDVNSRTDLETAMTILKRDLTLGDTIVGIVNRNGTNYNFTVELTEQLVFADTGYRISVGQTQN